MNGPKACLCEVCSNVGRTRIVPCEVREQAFRRTRACRHGLYVCLNPSHRLSIYVSSRRGVSIATAVSLAELALSRLSLVNMATWLGLA